MTWGDDPVDHAHARGLHPDSAVRPGRGLRARRPHGSAFRSPGTTIKVDALPNRPDVPRRLPQLRHASRRWPATHTVDADAPSGNRAGMPVVRATEDLGQLGHPEPGHASARADGLYRWIGAAAMDRDGEPRRSATRSATGRRRTTRASRTPGGSRAIRRTPSAQGEAMLHAGTARRPARPAAGATTR